MTSPHRRKVTYVDPAAHVLVVLNGVKVWAYRYQK